MGNSVRACAGLADRSSRPGPPRPRLNGVTQHSAAHELATQSTKVPLTAVAQLSYVPLAVASSPSGAEPVQGAANQPRLLLCRFPRSPDST